MVITDLQWGEDENHVADYYTGDAKTVVRLRPYRLAVVAFLLFCLLWLYNLKRDVLPKIKSDAQKKKSFTKKKIGLLLMEWVV